MAVASSYLAWTLAELGHEVTCYLAPGEPIPWTHELAEWRHRSPADGPDDWHADLTIATSAPSWPHMTCLASKAKALGRLVFWHHYGPVPPGCGAILARVAPSTERAKGWGLEIVLPPASWALYAGGERTGAEIVVPGAAKAKGGPIALQVARLLPELRWTVLAGRASEAELRPWREVGATVLQPGLAPEAWLSRARLILSPTRAETYGLAMAEAAALGIPVVTSDLPGPRFALGDAATYLPTDAPAQAWADAVQAALDTDPVRLQPQAYPEVVRRALALGAPRRSAPRPPQPVQRRPCPTLPLAGQPRLVSLLMAVGPVSRWLAEAVRSVLEQELPEGWRLELLIGVDGVPESLEAARALPPDPRVGIVSLATPAGTYVVANTLLQHARGELVGRVDADDVMLPGRLAALIASTEDPAVGMANSRIADVDEDLHPLKPYERAADGIWLWRRSVLDYLGGWRSWPCGADTELLQRAHLRGFRGSIVDEVLYLRRRHGEQLTRAVETRNGAPLRDAAWGWIKAQKALGALGVCPPRIVPETARHSVEGPLFSGPIWAGLASIPGRREILGRVVASLLPQVDRLNVYLNGWPDVPDCLLGDSRIVVARSQEHGDRGDAGKMFWADEAPGYYLSCDDDILYPPDYTSRLVAALQERGNRAIVGVHGVLLPPRVVSYRAGRRVFRFMEPLDVDTPVHLLGTGAAGWHAPTVRVTRDLFLVPNMADVWLAAMGQQQRIPFFCLRREAGWLRDIDCCYLDSIYQHAKQRTGSDRDRESIETAVIRSQEPWHLWGHEET
jgi:glycosyltransferase involved in cell wall biosynthesis